MSIRDLWQIEALPPLAGLNSAANLAQLGVPGMATVGATTADAIRTTNDNWLGIGSGTGATSSAAIYFPLSSVWDGVSTQSWYGFRTRLIAAWASTKPSILSTANASGVAQQSLITDTQMTTWGKDTPYCEYFVEVFIDRSALTYQVWIDGTQVTSGALSAVPTYFLLGTNAAAVGAALAQRQFRSFYFLDVDATAPNSRLGAIESVAIPTAFSATAWGTSDDSPLNTVLSTRFSSVLSAVPVATPTVGYSKALAVMSPPALLPNIFAMQSNVSLAGNSSAVSVAQTYEQGATVANAGSYSLTNTTMLYNQRIISLTGPGGAAWTRALVAASNLGLMPSAA